VAPLAGSHPPFLYTSRLFLSPRVEFFQIPKLPFLNTRLEKLVDAEGVTGIVKCDGSGDFSAAVAGTDYNNMTPNEVWLNTQIFR
jgi:hypothetical protein